MKIQLDRLACLFASITDAVVDTAAIRKTQTRSTAEVSRDCGLIAVEFHLMTLNRCTNFQQQSVKAHVECSL